MAGILSSVLERSTLRRWSKVAERVDALDPVTLAKVRGHARRLSRRLDEVLHVVEGRLARPVAAVNDNARPLHVDWAWRPDVWAGPVRPVGRAPVANGDGFGPALKIFHDCPAAEVAMRQVRNPASDAATPFGLRFDVLRFRGSFLSAVIELPEPVARNLTRRHLLRLDLDIEAEIPVEVFGRLNLRHGPNTERLVREVPLSRATHAEFDLSEAAEIMGPVERAWIDVIFEGPELNQIMLRDLRLSRRPRAEV